MEAMKALALRLIDRADDLGWLKHPSNVEVTDRMTQARYYRAAALLLLNKPQEAISGLVTVSGATDWEWALSMQKGIYRYRMMYAPTTN